MLSAAAAICFEVSELEPLRWVGVSVESRQTSALAAGAEIPLSN